MNSTSKFPVLMTLVALATLTVMVRESDAGPYGQTVYRLEYQISVNWYHPLTGERTATNSTFVRNFYRVGSTWSERNNGAEIRQLWHYWRRNGWQRLDSNWRIVRQGCLP